MAAGYIAFDPTGGTTGPGTTVSVVDGKFTITAASKLAPGKYQVRIGSSKMVHSGEKLPPDYFPPWQTIAELKGDGTPLMFDVPIK